MWRGASRPRSEVNCPGCTHAFLGTTRLHAPQPLPLKAWAGVTFPAWTERSGSPARLPLGALLPAATVPRGGPGDNGLQPGNGIPARGLCSWREGPGANEKVCGSDRTALRRRWLRSSFKPSIPGLVASGISQKADPLPPTPPLRFPAPHPDSAEPCAGLGAGPCLREARRGVRGWGPQRERMERVLVLLAVASPCTATVDPFQSPRMSR